MEKLNNIWDTLPVWDKVEALEYLGIKLNLSDEDQVEIAGKKARAEKVEELNSARKTKIKTEEFFGNIKKGDHFGEAWSKLFTK